MKILLLGKTGQVGFELCRELAILGEVFAPGRSELDLMDEHAVTVYLEKCKPELIVNAAAWTAVDAAEEQRDDCKRLNEGLPEQLALYSENNGNRLIHYSSDYVYPGNGIEAWNESSHTAPLSYYGKTKLAGDQAIERSCADYLIFRTSWVYSARGNNFMKTMLRLGETKPELKIVADQIGSPTPARLIAQITTLAIYNRLEKGLYHLAPKGETSWHGFAKAIFQQTGRYNYGLVLDTDSVYSIPTSDYPTPAIRPLNSRLAVSKLEQALNIQLPSWENQLELTLSEYLER